MGRYGKLGFIDVIHRCPNFITRIIMTNNITIPTGVQLVRSSVSEFCGFEQNNIARRHLYLMRSSMKIFDEERPRVAAFVVIVRTFDVQNEPQWVRSFVEMHLKGRFVLEQPKPVHVSQIQIDATPFFHHKMKFFIYFCHEIISLDVLRLLTNNVVVFPLVATDVHPVANCLLKLLKEGTRNPAARKSVFGVVATHQGRIHRRRVPLEALGGIDDIRHLFQPVGLDSPPSLRIGNEFRNGPFVPAILITSKTQRLEFGVYGSRSRSSFCHSGIDNGSCCCNDEKRE
mmetsp:Transcript_23830/g.26562  ORF Transcript_23830/g.26562 Transcript_23830/m.26562 type:complete len:286 (-) Transcript_23830:135-992(-)